MPNSLLYIEHLVAQDAMPHAHQPSILDIFDVCPLLFLYLKSADLFASCVAICFDLYAFRK